MRGVVRTTILAVLSFALVATFVALAGTLLSAGGSGVPRAMASGPWAGGPFAGHWHGPSEAHLPPELLGLVDLPSGERFAHFRGAQLELTDRDNQARTVRVTPGVATTVTDSGLTIAVNDGSARSYALNDRTVIHGGLSRSGRGTARAGVAGGDRVVVVTLDDQTVATAVLRLSGRD